MLDYNYAWHLPIHCARICHCIRVCSFCGSALTHDQAGNRTAEPGGARTYGYNDANRLVEVFDNSVSTATYQHNAFGQRVKKTVGSNTMLFVYDLNGTLIAEHDSSGNLIRDYVWLNGAPAAQIDSGETFSYLHFDHLNTPRKATNDAQTVVWEWHSDAFGNGLADEDPDGDSTTTTVNIRFPGQYYDQETGLHYNYFRTYDPATGRYLESDPIGLNGGLNTYGYAYQNPLLYTDPTGETPAHAARAAWGVGRWGGRGFNWAWATATGLSFGAWLYEATHDPYNPNAPATPPLIPPMETPDSESLSFPWTDSMAMEGEQCEEDDTERCREVKNECIAGCSETALPTPDGLGHSFRVCVRECMEAQGCFNF